MAQEPTGPPPSRAAWLLRVGAILGGLFAVVMIVFLLLSAVAGGARGAGLVGVAGIGVAAGVLFGILMVLFLGVLDGYRRRRAGVPFSPSTRASAQVVVRASPEQVGPWAWEVLRCLGREPAYDAASGTMSVSTRAGWWSYGETVSVRLGDGRDVGAAAGTTWVEVSSRPRLRTQLVDYGSNQVRVRDVVAAVQRGPSAPPAPPARP